MRLPYPDGLRFENRTSAEPSQRDGPLIEFRDDFDSVHGEGMRPPR